MIMNETLIAERLQRVQTTISAAAVRSGRTAADVTLIAVSKTADRAAIDAAYAAGQRDFGENRIQDALSRFDSTFPADARLHMIGSLQSNKAGKAIEHFDLIHSVDRGSLVQELQRQAARRDKIQEILIEVNVAGEEQKGGCPLLELGGFIGSVLDQPNLCVRGLMTMAPLSADSESVRWVFARLREAEIEVNRLYPEANLTVLSMGMTNDFEVAIEEGATHVRVGRAIFGG